MSDARDKLQAAIDAKKKGGGPIAAPASKPPPPSAAKAGPTKPKKAKSSFLKKKKKKPKKKAEPKKGSAGGSAIGAVFSKLAKTFVDELKEATSEIRPGQLLETARDSISNLNLGKSNVQEKTPEVSTEESSVRGKMESDRAASATPPGDEAPKEFSTVKVKKAPPERRKRKPTAEPEPVAAKEPILTPEEPEALPGKSSERAAATEDPVSDQPAGDAMSSSPEAGVTATETEDEPGPLATDEPKEVGIVDEVSEPVAEIADPPETVEDDTPIGDQELVGPGESKTLVSETTTEGAEPQKGPSKERPKRSTRQTVHVSKEEHLVRAFHSLHKILNNEIWNPIVTASDSKPSSLFAPRRHFDKVWAIPEFREGLKSAIRLASGFSIDPAETEFDERAIEAVKNYAFDPHHTIKPHTELITKAIGNQATEEVLELVKKRQVRKLLYSIGTRLGTFVPTIEILARIYIGLKKKEDIKPGDRLHIQEEVLMKYNKSPYTEDLGKKARNLSLNYFTDYLTEYGFNLYKNRIEQAPDGQDHLSTQKRRHGTIKESCCNITREWGVKVGLSSPAMMNLEGRLMEMADNHLAALVGEVPDDQEDGG